MASDSILFSKETGSSSSAAITSSFTDLGSEIVLRNNRRSIGINLYNSHASVALTDFQILGKVHPDGAFVVLVTGATWGTVAGIVKHFTGALNTLAATSNALAYLDLPPLYSIKFQAKTGTTGAATVYWNLA